MRLFKYALWMNMLLMLLVGCSSGASRPNTIGQGVVIEKGKTTLLFFYTDN